jgi:enoyl-CoA hydratase
MIARRGGIERMDEPVLQITRRDGVATLTLNRPRAMNALSRELRAAIVDAFTTLGRDDATGVIILTGSGRAFCAGLDLKELGGEAGDGQARPDAVIGSGADIVQAMAACDRPIIGAINGFAITGGFELALACDLLVASTEARFADTHARVGILPGWGLSQKLSRAVGIVRAKELSLTGNYLSAAQAEAWGLVNRVVAPDELLPTCDALARDMLSCVPEVMRAYKRIIDDGFAATFADGLRIETTANREHARGLTPALIAERRRGVQDRGRTQSR